MTMNTEDEKRDEQQAMQVNHHQGPPPSPTSSSNSRKINFFQEMREKRQSRGDEKKSFQAILIQQVFRSKRLEVFNGA